jgi:FkbM family methyltransferase
MGDYRNYEVKGVKMYKSGFNETWFNHYLSNPPEVIVEFGSYDCGDGVYYKNLFPNAEVYSIEACPERYNVVKENGSKFGIKTFNYAVTDSIGEVDFYQVKDPNVMDNKDYYGSSGSINQRTDFYKKTFDHVKEQTPIKVPSITLEKFCNDNNIKHIDFLHLDVEGAEQKVVSGFGDIKPELLWLEVYLGKKYYGDGAYETDSLFNELKSIGYELLRTEGADALFRLKKN